MGDIMKSKKIMTLVLLCILMVGAVTGCASDKNMRNYLQALLDSSYKNDATVFVDMKLGSEKEAQALYERGVDTGTEAFCTMLNIPEELRSDFRQIYMDMLSKVHYTVGKAERQSDGSYIVTISYERMLLFQPTLNTHAAKTAQLYKTWADSPDTAPTDENEIMKLIIIALMESIQESLTDVSYAEEETTTVRIELVDNVYTPNTNDMQNLERLLFDADTAQ